MTTYIKRIQKDYTLAFKLAVIAEVEAGAMTYKQAQKHYGIQEINSFSLVEKI